MQDVTGVRGRVSGMDDCTSTANGTNGYLANGRIVTLWVEQGGAMWNRLHRPRGRYTRSGASTQPEGEQP